MKKISYYTKPEDMTLEQWQIALRVQTAQKEAFDIEEDSSKDQPGYYKVNNWTNNSQYKVVFRGENSQWNYCSCMDFRSSRLGTCKHLEAVKLWIKNNNKKVCRKKPAYTSVYLSYRGERKVCLRIGTDNAEEFRLLAKPYFYDDGTMRPEAIDTIIEFLAKAKLVNDTFRYYKDAILFIIEQRDRKRRENLLSKSDTEEIIDNILKTKLYTYQKEGIRFAFRAGKSLIADEMGLGKTIQALGTAELMRHFGMISSCLIVCPTSLKYQWKKEIERFTASDSIIVEGSHNKRKEQYDADEFYKIVSYNSISNDIKILKTLHTDFLIMDEVQRLKNWNTQISKSARHIESEYAVVLSGTPLENKLEELYSIMQFVDQYCLGPLYLFMDQTVIRSGSTGKIIGYKNLNAVGERMKDVLIRRKKSDVALQLPERIDKTLFVPMTEQQRSMHEDWQRQVGIIVKRWARYHFLSEKDKNSLLMKLSQMRMVCDSTYILDQTSRHDTKIEETINILRNVIENGDEKVVIFSQWERMTRLVAKELDKIGIRYEYFHGGIPSEQRKVLMDNFTELPESRVFISTDAGSTGLNLQVASIIINLDLPWNPAVLEQRIARIYRIGQKRNIQVINLVSGNSIEERMIDKLHFKSSLFEGILDNGDDSVVLEESKFNKIMEGFAETIEQSESSDSEVSAIETDDTEEKADEPQPYISDDADKVAEPELEVPLEREKEYEHKAGISDKESAKALPEPDKLVSQGIAFLSGLAKTLSSKEATQKLVDSLVETDEKTGKTTLKIEIPDKESVVNVLGLFGKLFGK